MKKYRLKNKFRFYTFITLTIVLTILSIVIIKTDNVQGEMLNKYDIIIVDSGDTIWEIAQQHNDNQYKDLREFVYKIKKVNNMFGDILTPNQQLKIPKAL